MNTGNEKYLALLRGINVGGRNIIRMEDLKVCFCSMGFENVSTFIQSGNVIFETGTREIQEMERQIEQALEKRFAIPISIVLVSFQGLKQIVEQRPASFGSKPEEFRYDVWFLKPPLMASQVIAGLTLREDVDELYAGQGAVYACRLIVRASQSYMPKIIQKPFYRCITVRNWNTTQRLFEIMKNY